MSSELSTDELQESAPRLTPAQWGMVAFLTSEVALFSTLIVAYVIFFGRDALPNGMGGPTPRGALSLQLVVGTTICLLASSLTVHLAHYSLKRKRDGSFAVLWLLTIALGVAFLAGTAYEWRDLIVLHRLTISRNLFGTTFYTLVGFHALHVTAGVAVMLIVLVLTLRKVLTSRDRAAVELVTWYWHYVDVVWLAVFAVVYLMPYVA